MFHQRVQQPGETIENFVADVRNLSKTCQFGELEDSLLRDRIVVGIRDEPTRRRLLQQKQLTLSEAIDIRHVQGERSYFSSTARNRRRGVDSGSRRTKAIAVFIVGRSSVEVRN